MGDIILAGSTSGSITVAPPAAAGSGTLTLPTGTDTLVGKATTDTLTNKTVTAPVLSGSVTGTYTLAGTPTMGASLITSGTAVATTSGTSIDFTSIPSWVKRVTVTLSGVSTDGAPYLVLQIGDSGGIETSGYLGGVGNTGGRIIANSTFFHCTTSTTSGSTQDGAYVLTLLNASTNLWGMQGSAYLTGITMCIAGGSKPLSATLDRIRLTTSTGSANFDAGSVNILYE
jgi:hypothetical protein